MDKQAVNMDWLTEKVLPSDRVDNSIDLCNPISGWFFRHRTIRTGHLFPKRASIRAFLQAPSSISQRHETPPHLASLPLKRKLAATGTRAPHEQSIVGSFSQLPELSCVGGSVAPAVCHRALAAPRASPAAIGADAHNESMPATIPGGPAAVEPVGT